MAASVTVLLLFLPGKRRLSRSQAARDLPVKNLGAEPWLHPRVPPMRLHAIINRTSKGGHHVKCSSSLFQDQNRYAGLDHALDRIDGWAEE